jgi:ABC-2 type transport system ATP-binding protein
LCAELSKGLKQRVAIARTLLHDPPVVLLDEPTSGLDPLMEQAFQEVVRERRTEGCTVLLSSHILGEVEALADRVSIIRRGRTVTTGTLADLRRHTRTNVHAVTVEAPAGLADAAGVADLVSQRLDGHVDSRFTIDADHLDGAVGLLHTARIHTLTVTPPSLDALFLRTYAGEAGPLDATELGEPVEAVR